MIHVALASLLLTEKGNTISSFIAALNTSRPNLGQREKKQLKCLFSHFFVVFKKVFWRH